MKARRSAGAMLALLLFVATTGRLRAEPAAIAVMQAPVLNVVLQSGRLTIHTWDRPDVLVQSDGDVTWQHFDPQQTERRIPQTAVLIGRTANTAEGDVTLPPEPVALPPLGPSPHDGVVLRGSGDTDIVIPASTALVVARVMQGGIEITGYHNGVFVTQVGGGYEQFTDVSGVGITQVINGPIVARNSDFAHVRARTLRGNVLFENCNVREIEATSVLGSVTYDNGTFQPGLARFESQFGNVAIGVNGHAQIGAHSGPGQIISNAAGIQRHSATDADASFGGGGPMVTASSPHGKVILYNGALRNNTQLQQQREPQPPHVTQPPHVMHPPRATRPPHRHPP